jgi:homoserine dehydrogenase
MIYAAVLGYGVVGSGVCDVIAMNERQLEQHLGTKIRIKKILDIRDFPDSPYASLFTKNADDIFEDNEISIIAETIGGATIAYEFTKRALKNGKSVVTSNKELVADHGVELMQLAAKNNCSYLFEASVGGGIPIIRPLHRCLAANRISKIAAIINGTTNYILTQMQKSGQDFQDALKEAQEKGYAEQNPTADLEGHDARRKIAILASIILNGAYVDNKRIHTEGISSVTQNDIAYATALGCKVKLLAIFRRPENNENTAIVAPHILSVEEPICVADGVFNAISVRGNAIGDVMFYGQGAGKMATASAVVGDILDAALHRDRSAHIATWYNSERPVLSTHLNSKVKALVRVACDTTDRDIEKVFPNILYERIEGICEGEAAYIVGTDGLLTEEFLANALPTIPGLISRMRIY